MLVRMKSRRPCQRADHENHFQGTFSVSQFRISESNSPWMLRRPFVGVIHLIRRPTQIYYAITNLPNTQLTNGSKNEVGGRLRRRLCQRADREYHFQGTFSLRPFRMSKLISGLLGLEYPHGGPCVGVQQCSHTESSKRRTAFAINESLSPSPSLSLALSLGLSVSLLLSLSPSLPLPLPLFVPLLLPLPLSLGT